MSSEDATKKAKPPTATKSPSVVCALVSKAQPKIPPPSLALALPPPPKPSVRVRPAPAEAAAPIPPPVVAPSLVKQEVSQRVVSLAEGFYAPHDPDLWAEIERTVRPYIEALSEEELAEELTKIQQHPRFQEYIQYTCEEIGLDEYNFAEEDPLEEAIHFKTWLHQHYPAEAPKRKPALRKSSHTPPAKPAVKVKTSPEGTTPAVGARVRVAENAEVGQSLGFSGCQAKIPADYNERQKWQADFKRPATHTRVSIKVRLRHARKLKNPEANDIPTEFVEMWQAAVNSNAKAQRFLPRDACCVWPRQTRVPSLRDGSRRVRISLSGSFAKAQLDGKTSHLHRSMTA